ncbi:MAG TPA: RNA polymerase sigma factor [Gemmataceae bacterium]|nr:RNA polymerase sigma factor [Gemmataceae bacterium]
MALPLRTSFVYYPRDQSMPGRREARRGHVSNLLEEWAPRVYRFALRLAGDPHVAEDLTQETFLRAWRQRSRLRDHRAGLVWLFKIAANVWRDQLRRGRCLVARAGSGAEEYPDPAQAPDDLVAGREEVGRALAELALLPARQREVLYLSACEGLASSAIGEILGISADAVKANLWLARKKMRERLSLTDPA